MAQLGVVNNREPLRVFSGNGKNIAIVIRNLGDQNFNGEIRAQIWQTSSDTAVKLGEPLIKKFSSLPEQTVLESRRLDFPVVKSETKFLVEWLADANRVIGKTEVLVYPPNLLGELKSVLNGEDFGVLDPTGALKPALKQNGLQAIDLE